MSIIEAIIQGAVQGLTEFLPVSSSGHLSITQHIFGSSGSHLFFDVMLHIGTLLAVCVFYHKLLGKLIVEFFIMIKDIFTGKFKWKEMSHERRLIVTLIIGLVPLFLLFLPIPGTELQIKDLADIFTMQKFFIIVGISLLLTSVLLSLGELASRKTEKKKEDFTVFDSILVGLMQLCAAVFPGLSRSGSTLSVARMRKIDKERAFDYVFVMSIPTIIAAAFLELKDFTETASLSDIDFLPVIIGMIVSAIVGYFAIWLFKLLLKSEKMSIFIIYTFIVGLAVVIISIIEMNSGVNLFTNEPILF